MTPAVFLDLDNTVVHDTEGAFDLDRLCLIKGAAPAIASLRGLGYRIVVVANHEAVARGRLTEDQVRAMHERVSELVRETANGAVIDAYYYCPYHPKGEVAEYQKDHANRKPKPGMLLQAAKEMSLDLAKSWMIGDEIADVRAGHSAGTRAVLLRPDAEHLQPIDLSQLQGVTQDPADLDRPTGPDFFAVSLVDAARLIAQQPRAEAAEPKQAGAARKWDAEKIAKIQVPRPAQPAPQKLESAASGARAFRPWGAPVEEQDDTPIVPKPFRKRNTPTREESPKAQSPVAPAAPAAPAAAPESQQAVAEIEKQIPENIRQAIEQKKRSAGQGTEKESSTDKTLRLILHELRAQRGASQDYSFLTIIAVALQLVAVICVLGGLFMGGSDDSLFLRWMGVGLIAQLIAIATLINGR